MRYTGCTSTSFAALQHPPAKTLVSGHTVTVGRGPVVPNNPLSLDSPSFSLECKPPPLLTPLLLGLNAHSRMDIRALKEARVKMRWKKSGTNKANLDLKSWNKMLRSGGSGLEIFTFNGFGGGWTSGRWLLYGGDFYGEVSAECSFHSDAITHGLTLTGRGRRHCQPTDYMPYY